jgi:hypothetical protein
MAQMRLPSVAEIQTGDDSPLHQKQHVKENASEHIIQAEAVSDSGDHNEDQYEHMVEDDCADHHFGLSVSCNANEPYTNRGRSEAPWKILIAYGYRRSTSKG